MLQIWSQQPHKVDIWLSSSWECSCWPAHGATGTQVTPYPSSKLRYVYHVILCCRIPKLKLLQLCPAEIWVVMWWCWPRHQRVFFWLTQLNTRIHHPNPAPPSTRISNPVMSPKKCIIHEHILYTGRLLTKELNTNIGKTEAFCSYQDYITWTHRGKPKILQIPKLMQLFQSYRPVSSQTTASEVHSIFTP